ncbi:MAG: large conductance mechanosensitive channel protein MscL [Bacilli bacterium]|nr:large conductance mechanosensitive channel protein MscL [Bacilli bacterium]
MKVHNIIQDFKKFVNKGNILDLAIGILIGTAFSAMLSSLVNDIFMPLISKILDYDLSEAKIVLKEAVMDGDEVVKEAITLNYGNFIQTVITFLVIALSIFFAIKVVRYIQKKNAKRKIKFVLSLKEKHPELFDEEGEIGTVMYESLKAKYPKYFEDKDAQKIKERDEANKSATDIQIELLTSINEKLGQMCAKEDKEEEHK